MKKHRIMSIAIAALLLSAGAVFASGEDVDQNDPLPGGDQDSNAVELQFPKEFDTLGEACEAGFLREMRIRRRLLAHRLTPFYCNSGPAIQAALRFFYANMSEVTVDLASAIECPVDEE